MSKVLSNSRLFAAIAVIFAASTAFNALGGSMTAGGSGSRIAPDTIEMKSGPTMPPSPWDDEDEDGGTKLQASDSR